jgi:predicted O-methyltransferase YrrM
VSFAAIDFLRDFLKKHMTVFEWGSGGSTIFFAERVSHVVSVESDSSWQSIVQKRLSDLKLDNVTLLPCPLDDKGFVAAVDGWAPDLILIDGKEAEGSSRYECFQRAERVINPGGAIILDDAWRYADIRNNNSAKETLLLIGVGPCRYGVTSTAVFLY